MSRRMIWIGTLVVLAAVATCIRLGAWQLDRLEEKRALNAAIAERIALPALDLTGPVVDTAGLIFRRVLVRGEFDDAGTFVLGNRSHRGLPAVHLFTPLRIAGTDHAVLVNRGWVPSPDAATIELAPFATRGEVVVEGVALAFPEEGAGADAAAGPGASGATGATDPAARRVTRYRLDRAAIAAAYPGELASFYVQALPSGDAAGSGEPPFSLDVPEQDEGPHLSYAVQWFAFATIFAVGWIVILRRRGTGRVVAPGPGRRGPAAHLFVWPLLLLAPAPLAAQLRPLPPIDWSAVDDASSRTHVSAGAGVLLGQRASLAGTDGRLLELGNYGVVFRTGRIALEFGGTAVRVFRDDRVLEPPAPGTRPPNGSSRVDTGDHRVGTIVILTDPGSSFTALLRFGTRLPTTDDRIGLDRDETDFFATVASRARRGSWSLAAELGLAIHGSRAPGFDQADVLAYSAELRYEAGAVVPTLVVVGHEGFHARRIRGNEALGEVRAGIQLGESRWLRVEAVAGLEGFSPGGGLLVTAGWRR